MGTSVDLLWRCMNKNPQTQKGKAITLKLLGKKPTFGIIPTVYCIVLNYWGTRGRRVVVEVKRFQIYFSYLPFVVRNEKDCVSDI